ncbi:RNA helicase domain-containing protein [Bifidobacterium amazonense]|uniref:RNA helicase domain-containing protein n=1 Tax=Bifidobacterium amazonense TaxID=2809027 RepID=A0ABS9VS37_9BIFI|nr:RNA helicase domain-containing protein [Bifidobacterium amazonense]MCH9274888.1 RNA helicase domain-containing protein [Bifidobacterium amazonense]
MADTGKKDGSKPRKAKDPLKALDKVQARRFMVRFDLPDQDETAWGDGKAHELVEQALGKWSWIGQVEKGEKSGRIHAQLYVESPMKSPIRAGSIVRAVRAVTDTDGHKVSADVEKAKAKPSSCVAYVTKQKTRLLGPWSNKAMGEWPDPDGSERITREDLYHAVMAEGMGLREILADQSLAVAASTCMQWLRQVITTREALKWDTGGTRPVRCIYIYGDSNTGKSTAARALLADEYGGDGYFTVTDMDRDPWAGYESQRAVLFDDLRLPTPKISFQTWLRYTDRFDLQLSRRYENAYAAYETLVVTSNWSPDEQIESVRMALTDGKLRDEDVTAFYRRLTRVIHVDRYGNPRDETNRYHQALADRLTVTGEALKTLLDHDPPQPQGFDQTTPQSDGLADSDPEWNLGKLGSGQSYDSELSAEDLIA